MDFAKVEDLNLQKTAQPTQPIDRMGVGMSIVAFAQSSMTYLMGDEFFVLALGAVFD